VVGGLQSAVSSEDAFSVLPPTIDR